jgi:hypothetical protein
LHSKCYIFNGKGEAFGIIGSSNFTKKGLEDNAELNYLETTPHIVKYGVEGSIKGHNGWFNEKWEISQPWNKVFLEEILKQSPIGKNVGALRATPLPYRPYDVYIKFLQNLWGDVVDNKSVNMLENALPDKFDKIEYQFDAVNQGYSIMKRHNGFILADVVGQDDLEEIDDETDDLELNTSEKYGLILIDESHKFRNSDTQMYKTMDELIGTIYPNPYIVLLSATPQNNSPKDLKNQLFLFQREHNNTTLEKIEGRKLDTFFVEKERQFQELKKNPNNTKLIALSKDIREKVHDDILVRRTRTDIQKFYQKDAAKLKFPQVAAKRKVTLLFVKKLQKNRVKKATKTTTANLPLPIFPKIISLG